MWLTQADAMPQRNIECLRDERCVSQKHVQLAYDLPMCSSQIALLHVIEYLLMHGITIDFSWTLYSVWRKRH